MIRRLLIANRGEIAVRIARGARELGVTPFGVYSEADREALHLEFMADSACIGPADVTASYLNIEALLEAARALKADAVHPGYGFLSERSEFAKAVLDAGLIFVGPSPDAMEAMGSKQRAKALARAIGVPVVPGYDGAEQGAKRLRSEAERIGTPLLIKASAGGGGRGMRIVNDLADFEEALQSARREAKAAFGDDTVLLERYLQSPRHIEFQVLADTHGNVVHLGERECSIQRRHQKVIEEAPSVALSGEVRAAMGEAAVRLARAVNYVNAGTLEFMLDRNGDFYFLEMNTRLQVEHPVTESVYGVDLVHWQLRIASGERLTLHQEALGPRGAAIEARIYAEDPYNQMLPSTGTITVWQPAAGPGIRIDSGVQAGSEVSMYYDPMLAKLIVWGEDRPTAVKRMQYALKSFAIGGLQTNIPLLSWIASNEAFTAGETTTAFFDEQLRDDLFTQRPSLSRETLALATAAALQNGSAGWRLGSIGIPIRFAGGERTYAIEASATDDVTRYKLHGDLKGLLTVRQSGPTLAVQLDGEAISGTAVAEAVGIEVLRNGDRSCLRFAQPPSLEARSHASAGAAGAIVAPMPGRIIKVAVQSGDQVGERALLMVLEAMKMEHRIEAPSAGTIKRLFVKDGELVTAAAPLVEIE
ncbi:MAG: acetyl-CoA carboxylase biotin carboxylase subunit [Candidatus Eremiobacteraeota bacterium]|nr:acetyl-CoA carboxylase biotin carboxylase subunit [Candidatus Eremiobacteraeota bacterium]